MSDNPTTPTPPTAASSPITAAVVSTAANAAETELELAETKAEEYAFVHLLGTTRGETYYQAVIGNPVAQQAVKSGNVKAITWLEKIGMEFFAGGAGKQILGLIAKAGLA